MGDIYIRFNNPVLHLSGNDGPIKKMIKEAVGKTLTTISTHSNPDFKDALLKISHWFVEIDEIDKLPLREIGFDENNQPIVALPWHKNYGFWTDYEMKLEDFKTAFEISSIDRATFEKSWKKFENTYGKDRG